MEISAVIPRRGARRHFASPQIKNAESDPPRGSDAVIVSWLVRKCRLGRSKAISANRRKSGAPGATLAMEAIRGAAMLMIIATVITVIAVAGLLRLCELRTDEKEERGYWPQDGAAKQSSTHVL